MVHVSPLTNHPRPLVTVPQSSLVTLKPRLFYQHLGGDFRLCQWKGSVRAVRLCHIDRPWDLRSREP